MKSNVQANQIDLICASFVLFRLVSFGFVWFRLVWLSLAFSFSRFSVFLLLFIVIDAMDGQWWPYNVKCMRWLLTACRFLFNHHIRFAEAFVVILSISLLFYGHHIAITLGFDTNHVHCVARHRLSTFLSMFPEWSNIVRLHHVDIMC